MQMKGQGYLGLLKDAALAWSTLQTLRRLLAALLLLLGAPDHVHHFCLLHL
jgi:hypothetical protein